MDNLPTLVFANGDLDDGPTVQAALALPEPRLIIAADGGLHFVQLLGLTPQIVVGDMDSVSPDALRIAKMKKAEIKQFPAQKDETDLELALLEAVRCNGNPIRIVGAVGDRLDQTLGNVYLLALPQLRDRDVRLVSGRQTTWLAYPGRTQVTGHPGDTLSLIPVAGDAVGVVTENLDYPLRHELLQFGPARGISNVLSAKEASFTFESGLLLVVHTMGHA